MSELTFIFSKFDEERSNMANAEGRLVVTEEGQVIEIFEGSMRDCINTQLDMLHASGIIKVKLRTKKADRC